MPPAADSPPELLSISGLTVRLSVAGRLRPVIRDLSLTIGAGEAVGLVGESGSGKSMTARAIARLLPRHAVTEGAIHFAGDDVLTMGRRALRSYRLGGVSMIFQDPRAHTNPVRPIGAFLTEVLCRERGVSPVQARAQAIETLAAVGIPDGERRLRQYPHELSGGLLQRVMIAAALLAESRLILADEPTTALDVTTQAETMAILDGLRRERGLALLFITHDLELASAVCDRSAVMYAGSIVEVQGSERLHDDPLHPYTEALLGARPSIDRAVDRLATIPGRPRSGLEVQPGTCAFGDRCAHAAQRCAERDQQLRAVDGGLVRCERAEQRAEIRAAGAR